MLNHDPAPPVDPPLPDRPLDQLQVVEARHVLLHVAQEAQGLRTALGAMFARNDQHQLVTTEKVTRGIQALGDDLDNLVRTLGGAPARDVPFEKVHFASTPNGEVQPLCIRTTGRRMLLTSHPDNVTCRACKAVLGARERNEK